MASFFVQPYSFSAPLLQKVIVPSRFRYNYSSGLRSISSACLVIASSVFLRSVISRNISTTPVVLPSLSFIGAPLSSMGTSVSSFLIRTVWFAKANNHAFSRALGLMGFSTSRRVCSLTMLKTSLIGNNEASLSDQPVSSCCHAIHERDFTQSVSSDDGVADACQCGCPPLLAFPESSLCFF